jgi:hypothetical protein
MWRYGSGCLPGVSHERLGWPCQDACEVRTLELGTVLAVAVADGAGSAPRGGDGAKAVCRHFHDHVEQFRLAPELGVDAVRRWGERVFNSLRDHLREMAARADEPLEAYATTFLGAVLAPRYACFLQVGDGAIVVRDLRGRNWQLVFRPLRGEYANETLFLTSDGAADAQQIRPFEGDLDTVALFTDGIERVALYRMEEAPHGPFFEYVSDLVARAEDPDAAIRAFLASDALRQRVDDDLTLVVALRQDNDVHQP